MGNPSSSTTVNGFMGGGFGQGLDENIRLAYEWLIENYTDGDEIFIFGCSRGAYTARSLAGLIAMDGVLKAIPDRGERRFDRYPAGERKGGRCLGHRRFARLEGRKYPGHQAINVILNAYQPLPSRFISVEHAAQPLAEQAVVPTGSFPRLIC
jgi:T6SS, Phospholipase effector Tle1-like, catalytic domain